jgi:hypothetical protein
MTPDVLLPEAMNHHTLEKILPHRRNRFGPHRFTRGPDLLSPLTVCR